MDNSKIAALVDDVFKDNDEALAVALYLITRQEVMMQAESGISTGQVSLPNISPDALRLMCRYDVSLTDNKFYITNYSAIRAMMVMDDINIHTMAMHLAYAAKTGDMVSKQVVRDLLVTRASSLTYLVILDQGVKAGEEFNFALRAMTTLSGAENEYFKSEGL